MAKRWICRMSLILSATPDCWLLPLSKASSNPWGYGPIYQHFYSSSFGGKNVKAQTFDQERATTITSSNIFILQLKKRSETQKY